MWVSSSYDEQKEKGDIVDITVSEDSVDPEPTSTVIGELTTKIKLTLDGNMQKGIT
jgi:hypothetical protein